MSTIVTSARDIPRKRFYVLATDKFMSGWGHARGLTNVVCCPCDTVEEAEHIYRQLDSRREMIRVRITGSKPRPRSGWLISLFDRESATAWYPQS